MVADLGIVLAAAVGFAALRTAGLTIPYAYHVWVQRQRWKQYSRSATCSTEPLLGDDECAVCLDGLQGMSVRTLRCGHRFHTGCIDEWVIRGNNECPLCKFEFVDKMLSVY